MRDQQTFFLYRGGKFRSPGKTTTPATLPNRKKASKRLNVVRPIRLQFPQHSDETLITDTKEFFQVYVFTYIKNFKSLQTKIKTYKEVAREVLRDVINQYNKRVDFVFTKFLSVQQSRFRIDDELLDIFWEKKKTLKDYKFAEACMLWITYIYGMHARIDSMLSTYWAIKYYKTYQRQNIKHTPDDLGH